MKLYYIELSNRPIVNIFYLALYSHKVENVKNKIIIKYVDNKLAFRKYAINDTK